MIIKGKDLESFDGVKGNYIEGFQIKKLRKIADESGTIYHMLTKDDELFEDFGEIYFFNIYPVVVKA